MPTPNYTPLAPGQAPTYGTSGAGVAAYQQQLNQQNAGQAGWTPLTVDGFYGNLTQQAANFQPQQQGGAITPASLQPTTPINVPTGNTQTTPPITQNVADTFLSTLDLNANEKAAQTSQESLVAKMLANIQNQQGESAYKSELLAGSGLNTLKQDLQKYNSQILQKQAELNQSDIQLVNNMRNEERRDTLAPFAQMGQAKLAGDAAILRGLKTAEIGVLNALAIGKQGDIQLAKETVQEAVDAKYAPYKEQNTLYKAQLEAIQPFLDKAEKKQAAAQQFKLNQAIKEIDKISDFQKTALSNAISNNAPQSILSKISNAKTIDDILKVGSGYIMSIDDKIKQSKLSGAGVNLSPKVLSSAQFKNAQAASNLKNTLQKAIDTVNKYGNYEKLNATGKGILDSLKVQLRSEISTALEQGVVQPGEAAAFDSIAGQLNDSLFVRNKKTLGSLNSLLDSMGNRIKSQKAALQSGYGVTSEQIDSALGVLSSNTGEELTIDADGNIIIGGGDQSNEQFFSQ